MTPFSTLRAAAGGPEASVFHLAAIIKWLLGLRLIAVSALFLGVLLVQTTTDEMLPISPLIRVTGLTYALSLIWLVLWLIRIPLRLHGALQIIGDLGIFLTLVHLTGGPNSPFTFLFFAPIALAALMFGLRGALTAAAGAFILYAGLAELVVFSILKPSPWGSQGPTGPASVGFQIFVNGSGFALAAFLTSYLAHSLQQAEQRLRGERDSVARLMALSTDVLHSVDSGVVAAQTDGLVVLANPAARKILQRNEPLEGQALAAIMPLEGQSWKELLVKVARGEPVRFESTIETTGIPIGCTATALKAADGLAVGLVVHFRDLTESRAVATRERLHERMAAVGEMAAGIAHEIRNPLASISGSAQVLGRVPGLGESERRLSRIIVEESRRLSGIIESFLGYARPPDPERHPCDIGQTIEDTLTLFRNSPEVTSQHHIFLDVRPHPHPVVADEQQLRQAFYNLARNAIQAMPQGGTMRVDAYPAGDRYVIRWQDDGVGMEPRQVEEMFQPFRSFRHGGTGLGLAVVYSVVSDHGGDIAVDSAPGRGTVLTISLPLEPA